MTSTPYTAGSFLKSRSAHRISSDSSLVFWWVLCACVTDGNGIPVVTRETLSPCIHIGTSVIINDVYRIPAPFAASLKETVRRRFYSEKTAKGKGEFVL